MEDPGKLEGRPKTKKERLEDDKARQDRIEKSGFKVVGGTDYERQGDAPPVNHRFSDEILNSQFDPKKPGILDEGE